MTPADRFAATIVRAFLLPAVRAEDYQVRWKAVNRAAGAIVGYAIAEYDNDIMATKYLIPEVVHRLMTKIINKFENSLFTSPEAVRTMLMIAGPKGLQSRVLECLIAIGEVGE